MCEKYRMMKRERQRERGREEERDFMNVKIYVRVITRTIVLFKYKTIACLEEVGIEQNMRQGNGIISCDI